MDSENIQLSEGKDGVINSSEFGEVVLFGSIDTRTKLISSDI